MTEPSPVVTRFAPSPTGMLHIGGARTALFSWLFARHHGGQFRLRIEDTDRQRSTPEAVEAILEGLRWLELDWDGETVFQFSRAERHRAVAETLLAQGHAYRCYCTPEELEAMRATAKAEGRPMRYDGRWRDRDPSEAPAGVQPVIRLRAPQEGATIVADKVQGDVRFANEHLDDWVLLRSDGSPTYMLSVVVDDFDMGVTHVIRGDDHLTNAARQMQLIQALDWPVPVYAHVPLIHGPDGAKLSKRHGALSVDAYRDMGYLPEAMRNYLLRLGWSHGDEEVITTDQAIEWFNLESIGRSPARLDFGKLDNLNGRYLREATDERLIKALVALKGWALDEVAARRLTRLMPGLKERAKTLKELAENAEFLLASRPLVMDDKAAKILSPEVRALLTELQGVLSAVEPWEALPLEARVKDFAEEKRTKLGQIAQPLRAALTGSSTSPGIFDVLEALGRPESLARIADQAN